MPEEKPGRRAFQIYLYAVCLVTVLAVLFSTATAVYGIIRIAAPGTTAQGSGFDFPFGFSEEGTVIEGPGSDDLNDAERERGIAALAENGIFALFAGLIFWWHWEQGVRLRAEIAAEQRETAAPRRASRARKPT